MGEHQVDCVQVMRPDGTSIWVEAGELPPAQSRTVASFDEALAELKRVGTIPPDAPGLRAMHREFRRIDGARPHGRQADTSDTMQLPIADSGNWAYTALWAVVAIIIVGGTLLIAIAALADKMPACC